MRRRRRFPLPHRTRRAVPPERAGVGLWEIRRPAAARRTPRAFVHYPCLFTWTQNQPTRRLTVLTERRVLHDDGCERGAQPPQSSAHLLFLARMGYWRPRKSPPWLDALLQVHGFTGQLTNCTAQHGVAVVSPARTLANNFYPAHTAQLTLTPFKMRHGWRQVCIASPHIRSPSLPREKCKRRCVTFSSSANMV